VSNDELLFFEDLPEHDQEIIIELIISIIENKNKTEEE
jgi:hypothetical protein